MTYPKSQKEKYTGATTLEYAYKSAAKMQEIPKEKAQLEKLLTDLRIFMWIGGDELKLQIAQLLEGHSAIDKTAAGGSGGSAASSSSGPMVPPKPKGKSKAQSGEQRKKDDETHALKKAVSMFEW